MKKKETKQRRGKIGKYGQIKKNPVRRGKEEYKKGERKENKKWRLGTKRAWRKQGGKIFFFLNLKGKDKRDKQEERKNGKWGSL